MQISVSVYYYVFIITTKYMSLTHADKVNIVNNSGNENTSKYNGWMTEEESVKSRNLSESRNYV